MDKHTFRPLIGLVGPGKSLFSRYLSWKYAIALKREGADVKVLPFVTDDESAQRELSGCQGFLLPGGDDIDPALYGEEKHPACGKLALQRDVTDPLYLKAAQKMNLPILGICRGIQMINVFFGGTLYQDIPTELSGKPLNHSSYIGHARTIHTVRVEPGTLLSRLCAPEQGVNSIHHQGVKDVAPGLIPVAKSPDGLAEALEREEDGPFFLAVQWHPEHLYRHDDGCAAKIFQAFINAARNCRE